ncbi:MAG: TonB C-terminal domain-containing protein [Nannocystaceae bacterium]
MQAPRPPRGRVPQGSSGTRLLAYVLGSLALNLANVAAILGLITVPRPDPPPRELTIIELTETSPKREASLPADPVEPEPVEPEPVEPEPVEPEPLKPVEPEPVEPEWVEPEPELEPEPVEPEPELEPEPVLSLQNMKMVEQLDTLDEKQAPEHANYLSNVNREVADETRARTTNLEEDAEKTEASQVESSQEVVPGTSVRDRVAEREYRESQLARKAPPVAPQPVDRRPPSDDPRRSEQLSMRAQAARDSAEAQEEREERAREAEDGVLDAAAPQSATVLPLESRAYRESREEQFKFRLSRNDMSALFGDDPVARADVRSRQESENKGVWDDVRRRFQSPLENMVPEVQVGNQTALSSRKHPFARYIATIHRGIHKRFAYGYLAQLDTRGPGHALNEAGLWTRVEMVIGASGQLEKVITVHFSGNSEFDAAAREIVWAEEPFPAAPQAIRSGNGKVYMHWTFHRNERACGTFGVQPFILDNAGQGDRPDAHVEVVVDAPSRLRRRLGPRAGGGGAGEHRGHAHGRGEATRRGVVAGRSEAVAPEGPMLTPRSVTGPSAVIPPAGASWRRTGSSLPPAVPGLSAPRPVVGEPWQPGQRPEHQVTDKAAHAAAQAWLRGLRRGVAADMAVRSGLPFYVGATVAARSESELRSLLGNLIVDGKGGKARRVRLYTAAQLRAKFGSVPAGVLEGKRRIYAVATLGGDTFVLLLERRFGRWRVVGMTR